jgi:hypothetical protein
MAAVQSDAILRFEGRLQRIPVPPDELFYAYLLEPNVVNVPGLDEICDRSNGFFDRDRRIEARGATVPI